MMVKVYIKYLSVPIRMVIALKTGQTQSTYAKFLYHTSGAPIAPHEMPYRALLRHPNGPANPETLGSMLLAGTKTSSIKIIPVCDALRENFPSI